MEGDGQMGKGEREQGERQKEEKNRQTTFRQVQSLQCCGEVFFQRRDGLHSPFGASFPRPKPLSTKKNTKMCLTFVKKHLYGPKSFGKEFCGLTFADCGEKR